MNQKTMKTEKADAEKNEGPRVTPQFILDFDRISHSVLRNFLHQSGVKPDEYIAADMGRPMKWEYDSGLTMEFCKTLSANINNCAENVEALLSLASLLDQRRAPGEYLRTVLPHWLINSNALACLLLGRALLRSNEGEKAIIVLQQGLMIDPTSGSIHRELGLALRHQRQLKNATSLLEASLGLRGGLWFKNSIDSYVPVLVNRPNQCVDIYFYKQQFYVVGRSPESTGPSAKVIGGELFSVRRNAAYRLARSLLRFPLAQWFVAAIRERHRRSLVPPVEQFAQPNSRLHWRTVVAEWRWLALQRIALLMFASPIPRRAESILDAIELAREHGAESRAKETDAEHITRTAH